MNLLSLVDQVLKSGPDLDQKTFDEAQAPQLLPGLLVLAAAGLALHGLGFSLLAPVEIRCFPLIWAFPAAFIGALGVCLPSFYFYTLLGGVEAKWQQVCALGLRAVAFSGLVTAGLMPLMAAASLLARLTNGGTGSMLWLGYGLPFFAGLMGVRRLFRSMLALRKEVPSTRAGGMPLVTLMILAWAVLYTTIAPTLLAYFVHRI